jgi:hypothetical protein
MQHQTIVRTLIAALSIPALVMGGASAAQAADHKLTRAQMQQIVSSPALAPVGLGPATQNLFVYNNNRVPTAVCFRANGTVAKLPGGRPSGSLGYTLTDSNTVVGTSVIHYPTLNAARAASRVLMNPRCPDAASRTTDGGQPLVPVVQSTEALTPMQGFRGFISVAIDDQFATVHATRFAGNAAVSVSGSAAAGQAVALEAWARSAVDAAAQSVFAAKS